MYVQILFNFIQANTSIDEAASDTNEQMNGNVKAL